MIENEKENPRIRENTLYMLDKLKINRQTLADNIDLSIRTVDRIMKGYASGKTIKMLVEYYNQHGNLLYPHHVDEDLFQNSFLSTFTKPTWSSDQVAGEYVGLYLSGRGTGKPKAMIMKIFKNQDHLLEVVAIDTVQSLSGVTNLMNDVFSADGIYAREKYENAKNEKNALLRGSRFLYGEVTGRGDLMFIHLADDHEIYEVRMSTSLKSYVNTYNKVEKKYNMRGGAVLSTVYDIEGWPYSMIIGLIRKEYWHPDLMTCEEIRNALQRMNAYQKKENMLCLQNDVDALWYESFMEIHYSKTAEGIT